MRVNKGGAFNSLGTKKIRWLSRELGVGALRASLAYPRPASTVQSPSDEWEQEGEYARDREDRGQSLLVDVLRGFAGRTGQRPADSLGMRRFVR